MAQHTGGKKRSSWLTVRRRLLLVRLLLRGSITRDALIEAVQTELGQEGYPTAADSALKHDIDWLRAYGCEITFHRRSGAYTLENLDDLALLDLPDDCMEALLFLETSFPAGGDIPEYTNIRALLERIRLLLPAHRRRQYDTLGSPISFHLLGHPPRQIDPAVMTTVKRAIKQRRQLVFDYLSNFDEHPRRHRVAPYNIFFRAEGHGYLDATLLEANPRGNEAPNTTVFYRLNRIVSGSITILPDVLPPQRMQSPAYHLIYRLAPVVARRRDVTTYFPETHITYHEDGSATITATVTNLWQTRQILLRYGTACEVLEPPELRDLFRQTAQGLADLYRVE